METIIEKHNYFNPGLKYIKDSRITEYDITAAGFSILKFKQLLTNDKISELENLSKIERNIEVGRLQQQNPSFAKTIVNTLIEVRREFCNQNGIKRMNILAIKHDAIILVNKMAKILKTFDFFQFVNKGTFTSYLRIERYEFYLNSFTKAFVTKGFGSNVKHGIIDLIFDIMLKIEPLGKEETYLYLQKVQRDYLTYGLDKEVYREFTTGDPSNWKFSLKDFDVQLDEIDFVEKLDISSNYMGLLREAIINILN